MSIKDFEIIKELGKGSYGSVYKVIRKTDQKIYALKKVILTKLSKKEIENALNEVRLLASAENPNIIAYLDSFYDNTSNSICIVMEYADLGDLDTIIQSNKQQNKTINEPEVWEYIHQISKGLKYLHDNNILHRDLKAANIFIAKKQQIKIGDMNISKIYKYNVANTQTGTPFYASPEIWKNQNYDYKSDIWSFGCIIYEMCTNRPPFTGSSMEQVYQKVIKGKFDNLSSQYSLILKNLLSSIFQTNPIFRPSIEQILAISRSRMKIKEQEVDNLKDNNMMLQTIRLPRHLRDINQILPLSKYPSSAKM